MIRQPKKKKRPRQSYDQLPQGIRNRTGGRVEGHELQISSATETRSASSEDRGSMPRAHVGKHRNVRIPTHFEESEGPTLREPLLSSDDVYRSQFGILTYSDVPWLRHDMHFKVSHEDAVADYFKQNFSIFIFCNRSLTSDLKNHRIHMKMWHSTVLMDTILWTALVFYRVQVRHSKVINTSQ